MFPDDNVQRIRLFVVFCFFLLPGQCVLASSASSVGGGILPPPPPPPPPVVTLKSPSSESNDASAEKKIGNSVLNQSDGRIEFNEKKSDIDEKARNNLTVTKEIDASVKKDEFQWIQSSREKGTQKPFESNNFSGQQQQQQSVQPDFDKQQSQQNSIQQWGNPPHYQSQNHDPLQLHQASPAWGQPAQPSHQQQYYQQPYQHSSQQQIPLRHPQPQHPSQYSRAPSQQQHQTRQLALYTRPSPNTAASAAAAAAAAKTSATRLFSFARQKIQTGIDTVSETLDTTKVVSSVSGITSRIGGIGSAIGAVGNVGGPVRPSGPGVPAAGVRQMGGDGGPRQGGPGPGARSYVPPGMGGRQIPPQRMGPPANRQQMPQRESFAPPMSELYSLDQGMGADKGETVDMHDDHTTDNEDDTMQSMDSGAITEGELESHPGDSTLHHIDGHHDETDTDGEDEKHPDLHQRQSTTKPLARQPLSQYPGGRPPVKMQSQGQQMRPPMSHMPEQQARRPTPSSSNESWPNSGGSMSSSSSMQNRRRYDYDDDDDSSSIGGKMKSVLGSVHVPNVKRFFRGSSKPFDDGAWSDDESNESSALSGSKGLFRRFSGSSNKKVSSSSINSGAMSSNASSLRSRRMSSSRSSNSANIPHPVLSLLDRRETLISANAARKCVSIGRTQAVLDVSQLFFLVCAAREILPLFLTALASNASDSTATSGGLRMAIISTVLSTLDGWAPFALIAAFLVSASDAAWLHPALKVAAAEAASETEADAAYSQLYLRVVASLPILKSFSQGVIGQATKLQALHVASLARLHFFVTLSVIYVLVSTVAVLRPAGVALVSAVFSLVHLPVWENAPIEWGAVWESVKGVGFDLGGSLQNLLNTEFNVIRQQPLRVAVVVTLLIALISVSCLPSLEKRRKTCQVVGNMEDDQEDDALAGLWSNIGASSATRLGLLSSPRGMEGALERFSPEVQSKLTRKKKTRRRDTSVYLRSFQPLLIQLMYSTASLILLSVPLVIYFYVYANVPVSGEEGLNLSLKHITQNGWISLFDMAAMLLFAQYQLGSAARHAVDATNAKIGNSMTSFIRTLAGTVGEVQKLDAESTSGADFQAMLTASPIKGLVVSDLWAAHTSRKAWAVKGANVQCRNGEVVMIIGSEGSGKSRLLTAISEKIFVPPTPARTTTFVRGSINLAGVDLSKWVR